MAQLALPLAQETLTPAEQDGYATQLLAETLARFPLKRPVRIEWRNYRTTAGTAHYPTYSICLSKHLLDRPEHLRSTLLHEFAHLLAFDRHGKRGMGHGIAWKKAMADLGLPPEVRHALECRRNEVRQVVVLGCRKCGAEFMRARMLPRRRKYYHIGCGGQILFVRRQAKTAPPAAP